jgi:hypothetical protein
MPNDTLTVMADGQDFACRIARMQYPLTGSPTLEISDISDFILKVNVFVQGATRVNATPPKGHLGKIHERPTLCPLRMLNVIGHGDFNGPFLGIGKQDQLTRTEVSMRQRSLQNMRMSFARNAEVVFGGCDVGQNPWLLADLSVAWGGISVTAFTTLQTAGMPIFTGPKVTLRNRALVCAPPELAKLYHDKPDAHWKVGNIKVGNHRP